MTTSRPPRARLYYIVAAANIAAAAWFVLSGNAGLAAAFVALFVTFTAIGAAENQS